LERRRINSSSKPSVAFVGGSGLYQIPNFSNYKWLKIKSNFGQPSSDVCVGTLNNQRIAFLPRHGKNHTISPSKINYRANIEVLKILGVENIISLSAVGSLREDYKPGEFVLVDQFIDKTYLRKKTFFDDDLVVHIPFSNPICRNLKTTISKKLKKLSIKFHGTGSYVCIEGPQFSTFAESQLYRSWGCDVIGMTNMPEAKLALEAGICYAAVSMVTDYDCWHPNHDNVTIDQIVKTLNDNSEKAFKLITELCKSKKIECEKKKKELSKNSVITNLSAIKKSTKKKLSNIISGI